jgi:hypothetical protein
MTDRTTTSRSQSEDAEAAAAVPRTGDEALAVEATVAPVGTFAAGQSADGRYLAATGAPQGSFADGQAEEDEARLPEATETSPRAPASSAD